VTPQIPSLTILAGGLTLGIERALETLRVFHVNDSKNQRGSRVDRHEHLGRGRLGPEPFARILRDPRFRAVPKLLETPKGKDGVVMDRKNLAFLRRLAEETV
jgi:deoxyribonuclease-4